MMIVNSKKKGFTIAELIFVIVIIGILAAVALPKFQQTRNVVDIQKVKSEIAKIKMGIQSYLSDNIISGNLTCPALEKSTTDNTVFENVIKDGIPKNDNGILWTQNNNIYTVKLTNGEFSIQYDNNVSLNCPILCEDPNNEICKKVIK